MPTSPTLWPLLPIFGLDRSIGLFWCEEEEPDPLLTAVVLPLVWLQWSIFGVYIL